MPSDVYPSPRCDKNSINNLLQWGAEEICFSHRQNEHLGIILNPTTTLRPCSQCWDLRREILLLAHLHDKQISIPHNLCEVLSAAYVLQRDVSTIPIFKLLAWLWIFYVTMTATCKWSLPNTVRIGTGCVGVEARVATPLTARPRTQSKWCIVFLSWDLLNTFHITGAISEAIFHEEIAISDRPRKNEAFEVDVIKGEIQLI